MKDFEIERLLRAFGRKAHEHTLEGYMEFVRDFDSSQVRNAVSYAIDRADKLPVPAELKKMCSIGKIEEKAQCSLCTDKGFKLVGGETGEFDTQGFSVIAYDYPYLCKCGTVSTYKGSKRWVSTEEARIWNVARLLAKELGRRAAGSELTPDLRAWRKFWWIEKEMPTWIGYAQKLGGLVALVRLEELLDGEDKNDCAETPYRICDRLVPLAVRAGNSKMQIYKAVAG